jgi:SOS-response transcriptional repressor LexA
MFRMRGQRGLGMSRKAQALAYISDYLVRNGHSPSIVDIGRALGVSRTRAKALLHQLAVDRMIERAPGAQRAISVPGLKTRIAVEQLREAGWSVDEDIQRAEAFPQEHLPLVAVIAHVADPDSEDHHAPTQCP